MYRGKDNGFICPYCGEQTNGKIIDTRPFMEGRRRKRICENCKKQYITMETSILKYKGEKK